MKYLFFDVETTGLKAGRDRIVSIAWEFWEDELLVNKQHHIANCLDFRIPKFVVEIHGIDNAKAAAKGRPVQDILMEFLADSKRADLVIAHNVNFDFGFVKNECQLCFEVEYYRHFLDSSLFCTQRESTNIVKLQSPYLRQGKGAKYKYPRLSELHRFLFNAEFTNAHNADKDTEICRKCFFQLLHKNLIKL